MRETLTLSPLVMVRLGSINCSPIEDDEAYELIQVIDWLLEHEILLDNEEIFDLWAVEDSHGLPEPPPFPLRPIESEGIRGSMVLITNQTDRMCAR